MCEGNPLTEEVNDGGGGGPIPGAGGEGATGGRGMRNDNMNRRRRGRGRRHRPPSPERTAVDLPPPVFSIRDVDDGGEGVGGSDGDGEDDRGGFWRRRQPDAYRTPEYLRTLTAMPSVVSSLDDDAVDVGDGFGGGGHGRDCSMPASPPSLMEASWAPSASPLITTNGSYLVAATTSCHVCVWTSERILHDSPPSSSHLGFLIDGGGEYGSGAAAADGSAWNQTQDRGDGHEQEEMMAHATALSPDLVVDAHYEPPIQPAAEKNDTNNNKMKREGRQDQQQQQQQQQEPTAAAAHSTSTTRPPIVGLAEFAPCPSKHVAGRDDGNTTSEGCGNEAVLVAAVNDMGDVSIIRIAGGATAKADVVFQFRTDRCGVSSIAVVDAGARQQQPTRDDDRTRIVLSYSSSHVEVWSVPSSALSHGKSEKKDDVGRKGVGAQLVCRGCFQSGFPIRSVAQFATDANSTEKEKQVQESEDCQTAATATLEGDKEEEEEEDAMDGLKETPSKDDGDTDGQSKLDATEKKKKTTMKKYLIFSLQPDRQRSSASMVKVVDLTSLEAAWKERYATPSAAESSSTAAAELTCTTSPAGDRSLALEDYLVSPAAGMGIADASSVSQSSWIPSPGTDAFLPAPSVDSSDGNNCHSGRMICSLSDGTVCILSAKAKAAGRLTWGVVNDSDQLLLTYPCIGLGRVELPNAESRRGKEHPSTSEQYAVCCLRGATAYLVPLNDSADDKPLPTSSLRVIYYPHDIDSTMSPNQFVQSFTAGNLMHPAESRAQEPSKIPVLVYFWPGGLVEVYFCGLREKTSLPRSVLQSMVDNGSAKMLHKLLSSFAQREELHDRGPVWQEAFDELSKLAARNNPQQEQFLMLDEICSAHHTAFRTLLLQLAEN